MHILILNWKDIRHPLSGGAEYVTHKFAQQLVKQGHRLTLFAARPKRLPLAETIDGVSIVRRGTKISVYLHAAIFYLSISKTVDVIIDQIHGLPFFTPLYVKKPIIAYIHEIAGPIWFKEFVFPLGALGYIFEKCYFWFYKQIPFLTDAGSTKEELVAYGIKPRRITVIPLTIEKQAAVKITKSKNPSLIYLGRMDPMKRIELLIEATFLLVPKIPNLHLVIAGTGKPEDIAKLKTLIEKRRLTQIIKLVGFVSEYKKRHLFARSWLHIHPSLKEGFGLTVLEAAAQKTPTIAFDVHGLRDVIIPEKNGMLLKLQTPTALAEEIERLIRTPRALQKLSENAYQWYRKTPTWNQQSKKLFTLLKSVYSTAS